MSYTTQLVVTYLLFIFTVITVFFLVVINPGIFNKTNLDVGTLNKYLYTIPIFSLFILGEIIIRIRKKYYSHNVEYGIKRYFYKGKTKVIPYTKLSLELIMAVIVGLTASHMFLAITFGEVGN